LAGDLRRTAQNNASSGQNVTATECRKTTGHLEDRSRGFFVKAWPSFASVGHTQRENLVRQMYVMAVQQQTPLHEVEGKAFEMPILGSSPTVEIGHSSSMASGQANGASL